MSNTLGLPQLFISLDESSPEVISLESDSFAAPASQVRGPGTTPQQSPGGLELPPSEPFPFPGPETIPLPFPETFPFPGPGGSGLPSNSPTQLPPGSGWPELPPFESFPLPPDLDFPPGSDPTSLPFPPTLPPGSGSGLPPSDPTSLPFPGPTSLPGISGNPTGIESLPIEFGSLA